MRTVWARLLIISVLMTGVLVMSATALSENASAAGVSGTWGSRIPGEGYMQTYIGPYGNTVTDYFDVELQLTDSGGTVAGTMHAWSAASDQMFDVWGTVSGSVFYMTVDFGWDGVNYLTPTYPLAIDGNTMFGSSSYENVGVMITGTFDLEKKGVFAVGGITPVVSAVSITIAIVAIVVAASPAKVAPKGQQPRVSRPPSQGPSYEPSRQWTTDTPHQQAPWGEATPVGGVGLHYPSKGTSGAVRQMTPSEVSALQSVSRPVRNNAIGMSAVSMVMAVMVNFIDDMIALLMPLVFCFIALGLAIQARKASAGVAQAVAKGTVMDVRGVPRWKGAAGGWDFGSFSVVNNSQLKNALADGALATVTVVPESKRVLSVNGAPLQKPAELRAAPGFEGMIVPAPPPRTQGQASVPDDEDLPPPPDEWAPSTCPRCGQGIRGGAVFCESCGARVRP